MLTIDELYDIAYDAVQESLKYQGLLRAIDRGMSEDDIEQLFPWVGLLGREDTSDDDSEMCIHPRTRPQLTIRDDREDTTDDDNESLVAMSTSGGYSRTATDEYTDGDASLTDDTLKVLDEYSDDDVGSCGACSCLHSS